MPPAAGSTGSGSTTAGPARPPEAAAGLLLRRARVWTPTRPDATAILLTGGRIAWIGDEDGVAGLLATGSLRGVTIRDCDGALVTPSFVDAHVHLFATGLVVAGGVGLGSLEDVPGVPALLAAVAAAADRLAPGEPVLGFGWDPARWADTPLPTHAELRRAAGGREVFLGRVDMHSALLAVDPATARVGRGTWSGPRRRPPAPGSAGADRDRDTDRNTDRNSDNDTDTGTGALVPWEQGSAAGAAFARLTAAPALRRRAIRSALAGAAAAGIGAVHEMAAPHLNPVSDLDLFTALDADPGVPRVLRWWGEHADAGGVARAQAAGALGCGGDLCVDGSVGSRTAAFVDPYDDAPDDDPVRTGVLQLGADSIARHVRACIEDRIGTGFHVIGDRAALAVTEGLQAATRISGGRLPIPVRLEHAEMLPAEVLPALAHLGVLASVQPGFQTRWGTPGGLYERRLGRRRTAGMNRLADLAAAGIPLAFGSDSPVLGLSGWEMVRAAVFHPDPAQRLTVRSAFTAATRGGWRAAGAPDRGVLVAGAPADVAVWDVPGELGVQTPDDRVAAWSTDLRAGVPALPLLEAAGDLPTLVSLFVAGNEVALPDGDPLPLR